ncbi:unnamed protein product, partial [marine sediment metagenome]
ARMGLGQMMEWLPILFLPALLKKLPKAPTTLEPVKTLFGMKYPPGALTDRQIKFYKMRPAPTAEWEWTEAWHATTAYQSLKPELRGTFFETDLFNTFKTFKMNPKNPEVAQGLFLRALQDEVLRRAWAPPTAAKPVVTPMLTGAKATIEKAPPQISKALTKVIETITTKNIPAAQITPAFIASQIPKGVVLEKTTSLIAQLKDLGHTAEAITAMKPKEAWANLFKAAVAPAPVPPEVVKPPVEPITPELSDKRASEAVTEPRPPVEAAPESVPRET